MNTTINKNDYTQHFALILKAKVLYKVEPVHILHQKLGTYLHLYVQVIFTCMRRLARA